MRTLVLLLVFITVTHAQNAPLPAVWRFTLSDSVRFISPSYNDKHWSTVAVPGSWETQTAPDHDGTAWYRTEFTVPPALQRGDVVLALGLIDDVDSTWLNGEPLGGMGTVSPVFEPAWNKQRVYRIPARRLRKKNTLAVRVYDGGGPGGIVGGVLGLYNDASYKEAFFIGPAPKRSYTKLTTTNGLIAAVYDDVSDRIVSVSPHIFQAYDSARFVRPFAYGIRPEVTERPRSVRYDSNTHVIAVRYPRFTMRYFAPFTTGEKVFVAAAEGPEKVLRALTMEAHEGTGTLLRAEAKRLGERYFLFSFNDPLHRNDEVIARAAKRIASSARSLADEEVAWMRSIIAQARIPSGVTAEERNTAEQSVSVLTMAQVGPNEVFPHAPGQILASLPPGVWNIAWVRDGCYAVTALARMGLFDAAKRGLTFMLSAPSNHYQEFMHTDGRDHGVGADYQISVCRYFGSGKEESDFNENGPNIEIDGFGLFLSSVAAYVRESGDTAFVREHREILTKRIADPILRSIAPNGLIRRESGPWERHLPGEQYSYTAAACAAGLLDIAPLLRAAGVEAGPYLAGAATLQNGIRTVLVDATGAVMGRAGAPADHKEYRDGGSYEVFASGAIVDTALFRSHMAAFEPVLRVPDPQRGYIRIKSPDWYECQEWIFLDMRIATAHVRYGEPAKAKHLLDWVTAQARFNYHLIPEMYGYEQATYEGAIPMVGFGAGAYLIALTDLYRSR